MASKRDDSCCRGAVRSAATTPRPSTTTGGLQRDYNDNSSEILSETARSHTAPNEQRSTKAAASHATMCPAFVNPARGDRSGNNTSNASRDQCAVDRKQPAPEKPALPLPPDVISDVTISSSATTLQVVDDALNNEFFYDDEFTVPFDARLNENQQNALNLIVMSNDDVTLQRHLASVAVTTGRMTSSKSDSCLYLAGVGVGSGGDDVDYSQYDATAVSQELTASEREDLNSSSCSLVGELSNAPLFSPQTSMTTSGQQRQQLSASTRDYTTLTGSYLSGGDATRYDYDWRANKDQYMLSFDRNVMKCSSVESSMSASLAAPEVVSTQEQQDAADASLATKARAPEAETLTTTTTTSGRLTTWATQRRSVTSQSSSSPLSSSSETRAAESQTTVDGRCRCKDEKSQQPPAAVRPACLPSNNTVPESDKPEVQQRTMTSWKAIRTPSPGRSFNDKSTGGGNSYYDNANATAAAASRQQQHQPDVISMAEMRENQMKHLHLELSPASDSTRQAASQSSEYHTCSEGRESVQSQQQQQQQQQQKDLPRRRSSPLLELYIRSKTGSDVDLSSIGDALEKLRTPDLTHTDTSSSSNQLRRLTGTWSMSTASSRSSRHGDESPPVTSPRHECVGGGGGGVVMDASAEERLVRLRHWNTRKNLSHTDALAGSNDSSSDYTGIQNINLHEFQGRSARHMDASVEKTLDNRNGQRKSRENSTQWPPCLNSTSVQTSLNYPSPGAAEAATASPSRSANERYSLIDTAVQTPPTSRRRASSAPFSVRSERLDHLPTSHVSPITGRNRMSRQMRLKQDVLPDLSFLNNGVTASSIFRSASTPDLQRCSTRQSSRDKPEVNNEKQDNKDFPPPVPPRMRRNIAATQSASTRESSPAIGAGMRRAASSSISVCSSSSSGIDPGRSSCDSQLNRLGALSGEYLASDAALYSAAAPPPHIKDWSKYLAINADRICIACHGRLEGQVSSRNSIDPASNSNSSQENKVLAMHPSQRHMLQAAATAATTNGPCTPNTRDYPQGNVCDTSGNNKSAAAHLHQCTISIETLKSDESCGSDVEQHSTGSSGHRHKMATATENERWMSEPVKLRRPLKSCLRRTADGAAKSEQALKHRSWSDPYDATVLRYSQDGETRYQLITNHQGKTSWTKLVEHQHRFKQTAAAAAVTSDDGADDVTDRNAAVLALLDERRGHVMPPSSRDVDALQQLQLQQQYEHAPAASISPDKIPMMTCGYGGATHAVLHSSSDSGEETMSSCVVATAGAGAGYSGSLDAAASRAKKTVSFADDVSYHSPNATPHASPKKTVSCDHISSSAQLQYRYHEHMTRPRDTTAVAALLNNATTENSGVAKRMAGGAAVIDVTPPPKPPRLGQTRHLSLDVVTSSPPTSVSSSASSSISMTLAEVEQQLLLQKQELVFRLARAAETLCLCVKSGAADDASDKDLLASSRHHPRVAHVALETLCPALIALVSDGLRPAVRTVFGKVKNSPWRVMEDSTCQGSAARVLSTLVKDLNELDFLTDTRMKFNAFVFGLLNNRATDFWLSFICNHEALIVTNYAPTSFVSLSQSTARHLFLEVITALQPLANIPFRLEYNFEYKLVKARQDERLSDLLLHKHTSTASMDARLERILTHSSATSGGGGGIGGGATRPLSVDEAMDLLSNSDDSLPMTSASALLRDSVQLKFDSLRQYSSAVIETTERTKSLLRVTGDSIKERFKAIQKQNRSGDVGAGLRQYLPSSPEALLGHAPRRSRAAARRGPMRVPRLLDVNSDEMTSSSDDSCADYSMPPDTPRSNCGSRSNLLRSKRRSQSLDAISVVKDGEILMDDSVSLERARPIQKANSLTELVTFIGRKIVDLTGSIGGGGGSLGGSSSRLDDKAYKEGVTSYRFDASEDTADSLRTQTKVNSGSTQGRLTEVRAANENHESATDGVKSKGSELTAAKCSSKQSTCLSDVTARTTTADVNTARVDVEVPGAEQRNHVTPADVVGCQVTDAGCDDVICEASPAPALPVLSHRAPAAATNNSALSRTARMFTRRVGASLVSAFDRLLLDPRRKAIPPAPTAADVTSNPSQASAAAPSAEKIPHSLSANDRLSDSTADVDCDVTDAARDVVETAAATVSGVEVVKRSQSATDFPKKCVRALCSVVSDDATQLSFTKGAALTVVKEVDAQWLLCCDDVRSGLVHRRFLQPTSGDI